MVVKIIQLKVIIDMAGQESILQALTRLHIQRNPANAKNNKIRPNNQHNLPTNPQFQSPTKRKIVLLQIFFKTNLYNRPFPKSFHSRFTSNQVWLSMATQ